MQIRRSVFCETTSSKTVTICNSSVPILLHFRIYKSMLCWFLYRVWAKRSELPRFARRALSTWLHLRDTVTALLVSLARWYCEGGKNGSNFQSKTNERVLTEKTNVASVVISYFVSIVWRDSLLVSLFCYSNGLFYSYNVCKHGLIPLWRIQFVACSRK